MKSIGKQYVFRVFFEGVNPLNPKKQVTAKAGPGLDLPEARTRHGLDLAFAVTPKKHIVFRWIS